jgi:hypothetical protein
VAPLFPKLPSGIKTPRASRDKPPAYNPRVLHRKSFLVAISEPWIINGVHGLCHTGRIGAMATEIHVSGEAATVVPPQGSNPPPDISTPLIRFPPFPEIPEGVSIIPFSQFRPKGIRKRLVPDSDHPDLDGHGRPTVALKVAHASTSSDKWKKKKRRLGECDDGVVRRYIWYEEWAKEEDSRKSLVD